MLTGFISPAIIACLHSCIYKCLDKSTKTAGSYSLNETISLFFLLLVEKKIEDVKARDVTKTNSNACMIHKTTNT